MLQNGKFCYTQPPPSLPRSLFRAKYLRTFEAERKGSRKHQRGMMFVFFWYFVGSFLAEKTSGKMICFLPRLLVWCFCLDSACVGVLRKSFSASASGPLEGVGQWSIRFPRSQRNSEKIDFQAIWQPSKNNWWTCRMLAYAHDLVCGITAYLLDTKCDLDMSHFICTAPSRGTLVPVAWIVPVSTAGHFL